jgi:hypothetical protein
MADLPEATMSAVYIDETLGIINVYATRYSKVAETHSAQCQCRHPAALSPPRPIPAIGDWLRSRVSQRLGLGLQDPERRRMRPWSAIAATGQVRATGYAGHGQPVFVCCLKQSDADRTGTSALGSAWGRRLVCSLYCDMSSGFDKNG